MPDFYTTVGIAARDWDRIYRQGFSSADPDALFESVDKALSEIVGTNLCAHILPIPDALTDTPHELTRGEREALADKYGAVSRADWASINYGTRLGTFDVKLNRLQGDGDPIAIEFVSTWQPPNAAMLAKIEHYLCEKYYLKSFTWVGHNPRSNKTAVLETTKSGSK